MIVPLIAADQLTKYRFRYQSILSTCMILLAVFFLSVEINSIAFGLYHLSHSQAKVAMADQMSDMKHVGSHRT
jgi:hypothetical protein